MQDRTIYIPMPVSQALVLLTSRLRSLSAQPNRPALPGEYRLVDGKLVGFCDRASAIEAGRVTQPAGEFALVHIVISHVLGEALTWQGNLRGDTSGTCQVTVSPTGVSVLEQQGRFLLEVVPAAPQRDLSQLLGAGPTGWGGC